MFRRIPWFALSVFHALFLICGLLWAQFLPRSGDANSCYWTIQILPYVTCGAEISFSTLREIFFNAWLAPLYGVAFAVSILSAVFSGSLADGIRQLPGLALIWFQIVLIAVFIWGGLRRLLRLVAHRPAE